MHPLIIHSLDTPWKPDPEEDEKRDEKIMGSATKLKGIFWPGMNLFDSATPEMKRMRNQRKDGSILEQMINTSTVTEPLEYVYSTLSNGNFELERTRDIFGPPSIENSPAPVCRLFRVQTPRNNVNLTFFIGIQSTLAKETQAP